MYQVWKLTQKLPNEKTEQSEVDLCGAQSGADLNASEPGISTLEVAAAATAGSAREPGQLS